MFPRPGFNGKLLVPFTGAIHRSSHVPARNLLKSKGDQLDHSSSNFTGEMWQVSNSDSLEDPLLKELLQAFREDSQKLAADLLNGLWLQAAVSFVALFLAVSSTIRLLFLYFYPFPTRRFIGMELQAYPDIALTIVLFVLSIFSLNSYLTLRKRFSRLAELSQRLGR